MTIGVLFKRLASSSRCINSAKSVSCFATSSRLQTHVRTYATEHTPTPDARSHVPKAFSLSKRLQKSVNGTIRPKHRPVVGTLDYPSTSVNIPAKKLKSNPPVSTHPGRSIKSLSQQHKKGLSLISTHGKVATKAKSKVAKGIKKKVDDNTIKTVAISSIKALGKKLAETDATEATLGPGFLSEEWTDKLTPTDSLSSVLDKSAPPHVVPVENVVEGRIGPGIQGLVDVPPPTEQLPVATLAHGLDRVLFNPGVHWLQDPRSHVYNFTPWLEKIPKVNDFAFEKLTGFVSSSRDKDLRTLAKQEDKKFAGSTSSLSGMLSHIYFLLSEHKDVELSTLSQHFALENSTFTAGQRMPATVTLNFKDGVYAIDSLSSEHDDSDKNVLTWMGTLLENLLTKTPAEFNKFIRAESQPSEEAEKQPLREAFRFAKSDKFVMRSQLDCQDKRLPGTGVFDIKTRAAISIRMDILNYEENSGYMIKSQHGILESFEREYYDLVRSAFLKYSFQVRIGNMDGVMVAYHNTDRIYGFQYISLDEMDERIYGPVPGIGNKVFKKSIGLLEAILEEATKCYPDQSVDCLFETRRPGRMMDVFVYPSNWEGEKKERPITQLLVQVTHELDGQTVKSHQALKSVMQEWTVKYNISKASLPQETLAHDLQLAEDRKKRSLVLPSNVPLKDAKKYWETLSFSPSAVVNTKVFDEACFTTADSGIQKFRDLSREGRALYEELQRKRAGKPLYVLGQQVHENDLYTEAPSSPTIQRTKTTTLEIESETEKEQE